jgi:Domain of unknown function (DUF6894)
LLGGVGMSRYFFHVVGNGDVEFMDEDGEPFDAQQDAAAYAARIAAELAQAGDDYRGSAVFVSDEDGNELMHVTVKPKNNS